MSKTSKDLKFLTLEGIRHQLHLDPEPPEETQYITHLGLTAERKVLKYINRTYDEVVDMEGEWPEDLTHAALLLVSQWYNVRESVERASLSVVPYGNFDFLVKEYVKL